MKTESKATQIIDKLYKYLQREKRAKIIDKNKSVVRATVRKLCKSEYNSLGKPIGYNILRRKYFAIRSSDYCIDLPRFEKGGDIIAMGGMLSSCSEHTDSFYTIDELKQHIADNNLGLGSILETKDEETGITFQFPVTKIEICFRLEFEYSGSIPISIISCNEEGESICNNNSIQEYDDLSRKIEQSCKQSLYTSLVEPIKTTPIGSCGCKCQIDTKDMIEFVGKPRKCPSKPLFIKTSQ